MRFYPYTVQLALQNIHRFRWPLVLIALTCLSLALALWLQELDEEIEQKMSDQQWPLPARVYARPLELFTGLEIAQSDLIEELNWLGYRESDLLTPGHFQRRNFSIAIHSRGFSFSDAPEPATTVTVSFSANTITELSFADKNQTFMRLEPLVIGSIHPGRHEDRVIVSLDELPQGFSQALIAVEDRSFLTHHGISPKGILRALWINLKTGSKSQGASTITQQLVKNLFLSSEKTWGRKITEIFMALIMELRYEKDRILETFINEVFIAQDGNRAIHGFGLASQYFFDRPLGELLPHSYALLIGMLKAPTRYNPIRHPEQSMKRRNLVLTVMEQQGHLPVSEREIATEQPLALSNARESGGNPAYLDAVKRQLITDYALEDLQSTGLAIFTNYDPQLQKKAEESIRQSFLELSTRFGEQIASKNFLETALVLTEPNTGEVKAIVGGRDPRYAGFNRALDARRPVGSLLKPAIFLTALQNSNDYTLATPIKDEPVSLTQIDGSVWTPQNFNGEVDGAVIAIEALSRSLNLASINLGLEIGLSAVIDTLVSLGIATPLSELPSLLLGAQELSVMEVAQSYQTLAADGFTTPLQTIREVVTSEGETLSHYSINVSQKFDTDSIYLLKYAMATSMLSGTGRSAANVLPQGFNVAGKTGTSDEQRDSWFAGFSGDYLAVVWVGNDSNRKTPLTGSSGALKIWTKLFKKIARRSLDLSPPETITFSTIDPETGHKVPTACKAGIQLPFIEGTQPEATVRCPSTPTFTEWFKSLLR